MIIKYFVGICKFCSNNGGLNRIVQRKLQKHLIVRSLTMHHIGSIGIGININIDCTDSVLTWHRTTKICSVSTSVSLLKMCFLIKQSTIDASAYLHLQWCEKLRVSACPLAKTLEFSAYFFKT